MTTELNLKVAEQLREIAGLLDKQGANSFRVQAYLNAARTVEQLERSLQDIVQDEGLEGLVALPTIGAGIGRSIYEFVATGRMTRLQNLRGESDPVGVFAAIPGLGPALAKRIYERLHIDSLEALEAAAHDGRLLEVPGVGENRVKAVEAWLATVLGRRRVQLTARQRAASEPPIALLLSVDADYRRKAEAGALPRIAPKRFNPRGEAWLPVLHVSHENWHFTALFSNTALAHELKRTRDWVVIYFYDNHHQEGQHTVVTETRGPLVGKRVVRGRERECLAYYSQ